MTGTKTEFEDLFWDQICESGLPLPMRQFHFHPVRRWSVDFFWDSPVVLVVEVEGAVWTGGRHTRPSGFVKDVEKYNALTMAGYPLLRYTTGQVKSQVALFGVLEYFQSKGWSRE